MAETQLEVIKISSLPEATAIGSSDYAIVNSGGVTKKASASLFKGLQGNTGPQGIQGVNGKEVEITKDATYIKWRYVGESTWNNLVALADLKGDGLNVDLSSYQTKTDNLLNTTDKTIVGAINENKSNLDNIESNLNNHINNHPSGGNIDLSNYYTKQEVDKMFEAIYPYLPITKYGQLVIVQSDTSVFTNEIITLGISLDEPMENISEQVIYLTTTNNDITFSESILTFNATNYSTVQNVTITYNSTLPSLVDINIFGEETEVEQKIVSINYLKTVPSDIVRDGLTFNLDYREPIFSTVGQYNKLKEQINDLEFTVSGGTPTAETYTNKGITMDNAMYVYRSDYTNPLPIGYETGTLTFEYMVFNNIPSVPMELAGTRLKHAVANNNVTIFYLDSSGTAQNTALSCGTFTLNNSAKTIPQIIAIDGFAYVTIIINNGQVSTYCNGVKSSLSPSITNYQSLNYGIYIGSNMLPTPGIYGGVTNAVYSFFRTYNRVLSEQEINDNFEYEVNKSVDGEANVLPSSFTMTNGSSLEVVPYATPMYLNNNFEYTFYSEDESIISNNNTNISANNDGATNLVVSARNIITGDTVTKNVPIVVGQPTFPIFTSGRTLSVTDIVICNPITQMYVGEEYPLTAYLIPANNMMNDNLVQFTSSNTDVISVEYGVLNAKSIGSAVITVKDYNSTISTTLTVTVLEKIIETIPTNKILTVKASDYNISLDNTNPTNTTNGIINAINYASTNGYMKIIFPYGTYMVTPTIISDPLQGVINIPSNLIIDFKGSTVNIEPTDVSLSGYKMFAFGMRSKIENSSIINMIIKGDMKTTNLDVMTLSEHCGNIVFKEAINCGLDNVDSSESPGYSISFQRFPRNFADDIKPVVYSNFEVGKYDSSGNKIDVVKWWRTVNKIDISTLKDIFELGVIEGYSNYQCLVARLYEIVFYDQNNNFISKIENCLQFYRYDLPTNAYYCDIAVNQTNAPSGSIVGEHGALGACAQIYRLAEPYKCYIKNCSIHNNHDLGIAATGGKRWLFENNYFEKNGQHPNFAVNADVDYEDGWESAGCDIWRNNSFNSNRGIIFVSGTNIVFHNNKFNNRVFEMDTTAKRPQWYRIYKNTFIQTSFSYSSQAEAVIAENVMYNCKITNIGVANVGATYEVRLLNNYEN